MIIDLLPLSGTRPAYSAYETFANNRSLAFVDPDPD
jgi:hypothetical protein